MFLAISIFDSPAITAGLVFERFCYAASGVHGVLVKLHARCAAVPFAKRYVYPRLRAEAVAIIEIEKSARMETDVVQQLLAEIGADQVRGSAVTVFAVDEAQADARLPVWKPIPKRNLLD